MARQTDELVINRPHNRAAGSTLEAVEPAALFRAAVACAQPVALWRQPRERDVAGLVSFAPPEALHLVDFQRPQDGFVLAPFSDDTPSLFLRADARLQAGALVFAAGSAEQTALLAALASPAAAAPAWYAGPPCTDRSLGEAEFASLVASAVSFIRERKIAKVVVSRTATVDLPDGFDPGALFESLCRRYPDAFVSLVAVPGVGTWIGASPELLLGLEAGRLTTMALAGTQRLPAGVDLEAIQWGAKEKVEQEMVTQYIRSVFQEAGVEPVIERGPHTAAAGSVAHLQTIFQTDPARPLSMAQANAVLERLHPTSAVCGMPRPQALQFIEAREGYDRGFYSGYLGPVHWQGRSTLYVNLRCMQLRRAGASIYVGAGVTADSDPASEWAETALKARTILDALEEARLPVATA